MSVWILNDYYKNYDIAVNVEKYSDFSQKNSLPFVEVSSRS